MAPLSFDIAMWRMRRENPPDDALLFPHPAGGLWSRADFGNWRNRVWKPAVQAIATRDERLRWLASARPYDCRGSFVSLQLRAGATPLEVASWAGHSPQVMFRHYAGVIQELVGEPQLPAERQIDLAREAVIARTEDEVAELAASVVEAPTIGTGGMRTDAYRMYYRPPDPPDHLIDEGAKRRQQWERIHGHRGGRLRDDIGLT